MKKYMNIKMTIDPRVQKRLEEEPRLEAEGVFPPAEEIVVLEGEDADQEVFSERIVDPIEAYKHYLAVLALEDETPAIMERWMEILERDDADFENISEGPYGVSTPEEDAEHSMPIRFAKPGEFEKTKSLYLNFSHHFKNDRKALYYQLINERMFNNNFITGFKVKVTKNDVESNQLHMLNDKGCLFLFGLNGQVITVIVPSPRLIAKYYYTLNIDFNNRLPKPVMNSLEIGLAFRKRYGQLVFEYDPAKVEVPELKMSLPYSEDK